MKKIGLFLIFLLAFTALIPADIYIKEKNHTDSYYYGGVVEPAIDSTEEIWLAENRMAYITEGRIVIIDYNTKLISIINRSNKTYLQAEIPLDMKKILSQEIYILLGPRQVDGQVKETTETRTIDKWDCQGYEININQPYALEIKTWCALDVPFDWIRFNELYFNIRKLANYSDAYINELEKVKGFPISTDVTVSLPGTSFHSKSQISEISEKKTPSDVYAIPEGFQKKEQLTIDDLRNQ